MKILRRVCSSSYVKRKAFVLTIFNNYDGDVFANQKHNQFVPVMPKGSLQLGSIGRFDARQEGVYNVNNPGSVVLAFVVEGVFEVENRLLQPRDALALWNADAIEFEALSKDGILLILE